jgi:asparagine synthase (glutamine-hydrolysing)
MCRIAGIVSSTSEGVRSHAVQLMIDAMAQGGPDDHGIFEAGSVALGHRRLSIIDLSSAGHQPMMVERSKTIISYNGEIYNFRELRRALEKEGHTFDTQSDTEVIIRAYDAWGPQSFRRLMGMFAFAVYDSRSKITYLVRDPGGIKPMYYAARYDSTVFASEIRAFRKWQPEWPEDKSWQKLFLSFGFLPHPATTLQGVKALTPGHYLEIDAGGHANGEHRFHDIATPSTSIEGGGGLFEKVREEVIASVRRHLISDAPLGVFLSGGIDSSLLALLASKEVGSNLRTVSVNFREATYDEQRFQQLVLSKIPFHDHKAVVVSEEQFWNSWEDIWRAMDQPTIDGVNSYFVSQAARASGLKAVLSGLGADELFGGYGSFKRIGWMKALRALPGKKTLASLAGKRKDAFARVSFLNIPGPIGDYLFLRGLHTPDKVASILHCDEKEVWDLLSQLVLMVPAGLNNLDYASFLETDMYMRGQLLKDTDFMSMWFGLEVRVPYLDQGLVQLVRSHGLAGSYKSTHPKYLLTKPFADLLPAEIVSRKKQGFVFPFHLWLANGIDAGKNILPENQWRSLNVKEFLEGKIHWSKCWSGVVLNHFGKS